MKTKKQIKEIAKEIDGGASNDKINVFGDMGVERYSAWVALNWVLDGELLKDHQNEQLTALRRKEKE